MSDPFVGEIRMVGFSFAPVGWAFCNGQTMAISQNETLFNLIGTIYGGDGETTFALPDLQGRVPVHIGTARNGETFVIGQRAGSESVTLTTQQIPAHSHTARANDGTSGAAQNSPTGAYWNSWAAAPYSSAQNGTMNRTAVSFAGGSQPHDNMPPFLAINFVISLFGVFPTQN